MTVRQQMREWLVTLTWAVALAFVLRATVAEARSIPTPSMVPTMKIGDRVLEEKLVWRLTGLERGDIVIFQPPIATEVPYIKRIIGLPGEQVEVRDGQVYINGQPLAEPYIAEPPAYRYGPVDIPEGHVLVLGDNRNNSLDSHAWGTLPITAIEGRAVWRIWPLTRFGPL